MNITGRLLGVTFTIEWSRELSLAATERFDSEVSAVGRLHVDGRKFELEQQTRTGNEVRGGMLDFFQPRAGGGKKLVGVGEREGEG